MSASSKQKADEVVAQIEKVGCKGFAIQLELADPQVGQKMLAAAKESFGEDFKLHVLVHNAGEFGFFPLYAVRISVK